MSKLKWCVFVRVCVCEYVCDIVVFVCSCVKGSVPKVGDRVMVEASYNANMPFKWNALTVQMLTGPPVSITDMRWF